MKLIVNDNLYEMARKQLNSVLSIAKEQILFGIYAVEKDGVCELKKDTFDNVKELREAVLEYKNKGFKVFYNGK